MNYSLKRFSDLSVMEFYEIAQVRTEVFILEQTCFYHEFDGKDPGCLHLVARKDDEIAGYLRILPRGYTFEEASIGRVLVTKAYRGQGVSRAMMQQAIRYINETMGEQRIKISAQAHLAYYYRGFGFETVGSVYDDEGIPHVDMILEMVKPLEGADETDLLESQVEIREIASEDTWAIRHEVLWPDKPLSFVKVDEDQEGRHFGVYEDGTLVSVISVFLQENRMQFRKFATLRGFQGKGYGTLLMKRVLKVADEAGVDELWCNARWDKAEFYKKFGMEVGTEIFNREGLPYVIMKKGRD